MLIAKCEECGYVEQVPEKYAGCDLECPCGCTVHVPSRFKLKELALVTAPASRQVHMQSDESLGFGRLQFFLHIVASTAVCFVSLLMFGLTFPHLVSMVGCTVWQLVVTQKRLDDCGFSNVHAVPLAVVSATSLTAVLSPTMSLNSPALTGINLVFGLWELGVFVACLFQPGQTKVEKEA